MDWEPFPNIYVVELFRENDLSVRSVMWFDERVRKEKSVGLYAQRCYSKNDNTVKMNAFVSYPARLVQLKLAKRIWK